jgi:hypothetical protein
MALTRPERVLRVAELILADLGSPAHPLRNAGDPADRRQVVKALDQAIKVIRDAMTDYALAEGLALPS